jgi:penicillin-binding protein 1A
LTDTKKKIFKYALISLGTLFFGGVLIAIGVYAYFAKDLPDLTTMEDYKPNQVTKVYSRNNEVVGEFYVEKRFIVPYEDIPPHVIWAFVAAEDDRFFEHEGLDFQGIIRAAIANMKAGRIVQGGSTITQQVAKSLLLTPERSWKRKIQEAILSLAIERNFTKEEILYLYLNQIYLGAGAYGVGAAAEIYFQKTISELSIPEAALLGGLPQAPSKYSPMNSPRQAKERQRYVLQRLRGIDRISQEQYENAVDLPVKIYSRENLNKEIAPYFVETVRRYLLDKYGEDKVFREGLRVYTTMDLNLQKVAQKSIQNGLEQIDKRQGWRGPIDHIDPKDSEATVEKIKEHQREFLSKAQDFKILMPDGELAFRENPPEPKLDEVELAFRDKDLLRKNTPYRALVTNVNNKKKTARLLVGSLPGFLPLENMTWATKLDKESRWKPKLKYISRAIKPGDIIEVTFVGEKVGEKSSEQEENSKESEKGALEKRMPHLEFSLYQEPEVQGALISMKPNSGEVLSMVGGYDFRKSQFNRAIQSKRQLGSSFKPIIYASALEKGYTPATTLIDSPESLEGAEEALQWKPQNYDGKFKGEITLRKSLEQSRNIPTLKLFMDIGLQNILSFAKRLGLDGDYTEDLSLSLGSLSVSPYEITKTYAVFANGGKMVFPFFISRVEDNEGNILEEHTSQSLLQNYLKAQNLFPKASDLLAEKVMPKDSLEDSKDPASEGSQTPEEDTLTEPREALPAFDRVEYNASEVDFENPSRVMDQKISFLSTYLLKGVIQNGTGKGARNLNHPLAGKTGTTNDYVDAWFIGYSPEVVTGVWTGHDEQVTMGFGQTGGRSALPIWKDFMKAAIRKDKSRDFKVPQGIVFVPVNPRTGKLVKTGSQDTFLEAFVAGSEPSQEGQKNKRDQELEFFQQDFAY